MEFDSFRKGVGFIQELSKTPGSLIESQLLARQENHWLT